MFRSPSRFLTAAVVIVVTNAFLNACGSNNSSDNSSGPVLLAATLSLTGPLGAIGNPQQAGYQQLVDDLNAAGGIQIGGARRELTLRTLDNRSDPTTATQQASELALKDNAAVLLGSCTPPINQPLAQFADKNKVPFLTSCEPLGAFRSDAPASGWKYSWVFHFDERDQARVLIKAAILAQTDKKIAVFTDNEADGVIQRQLFKQYAGELGFTVVGDYTFPVGQSDFSSFIADAKNKQADVVVGQMTPPDGVALVKQMKSARYNPRVLSVAKAADTSSWLDGLGSLADGTVHNGFWTPDPSVPQTKALNDNFTKKFHDHASVGLAVAAYSAAQVAADAVSRAGSIDPDKVNASIGTSTLHTPFAAVKFSPDHTSKTPVTAEQWQKGATHQVFPQIPGITMHSPPPGLQ